MKVYLASAYCGRDLLRRLAVDFHEAGHDHTSRWLAATHEITPATEGAALGHDHAYTVQHVRQDFDDIDEADALVMFTPSALLALDPSLGTGVLGSGGRHIETGYALGHGKPVIVVGAPENIFHRGACHIVQTVEAAITVLDKLQAIRELPIARPL